MTVVTDHRLADAKAMPINEVADLLQIAGLKRAGGELVGPCPICGGRDRFAINPRKAQFLCRHCATDGGRGDQIALVMFVRGLDFLPALDWLCGPRHDLPPAEIARRAEAAKAAEDKRAAEAARYRERARREAWAIWSAGLPAEGTPVRDYLTRRGIGPALLPAIPPALRFHPDLPYMVSADRGAWREVHRGPAMLAAIQGPDGKFRSVHRTWLDLSRPKGKAAITDPVTGEPQAAKKSLGPVKGGAIRLRPEAASGATLIMAEGIETTLSAMIAEAMPGAAVWCGVSLPNMAGQRMHGQGLKYAGVPDLTDAEAFVPPPWVRDLVFIQDGDSDPRLTRAQLLSGCRRAMATVPGLSARIVPVPEGKDLNDVLMEARDA